MFLSQLLVNPGDHPDKPRPGLDWMKQTYRVHQRIWMAFPDTHRMKEDPFFLGAWSSDSLAKPKRQEGGFLFRIEPEPPLRILVQSTEKPRWDYAFQNAPHLLAGEPQVREYDPSCRTGRRPGVSIRFDASFRRMATAVESPTLSSPLGGNGWACGPSGMGSLQAITPSICGCSR
jgi:hypothetical protein